MKMTMVNSGLKGLSLTAPGSTSSQTSISESESERTLQGGLEYRQILTTNVAVRLKKVIITNNIGIQRNWKIEKKPLISKVFKKKSVLQGLRVKNDYSRA